MTSSAAGSDPGSRASLDSIDTVVLDLDGTLVDSVPVHVLAWQAAFREIGLQVASHRIQRVIGMGGDRLVAALTGDDVEQASGDELRRLHPVLLDELFDRIVPTDGATQMVSSMHERGLRLVLASSSDRDLTDRLLAVVPGAARLLDATVSGSDADQSKPAGDLVSVALRTVGASRAVLVGDAVWDVRSAQDADVPCLALLTGGISEGELHSAGAAAVFDSPGAVAKQVADDTLTWSV